MLPGVGYRGDAVVEVHGGAPRLVAQTRLRAWKSLKNKGKLVALTGIEPVFEP